MRTFTQQQYNIRSNVMLKNRLTNDELHGSIVNERDIEGKSFWVFNEDRRPGSKLLAKDAWLITSAKKKLK